MTSLVHVDRQADLPGRAFVATALVGPVDAAPAPESGLALADGTGDAAVANGYAGRYG